MFFVENTLTQFLGEFDKISPERKSALESISSFTVNGNPSKLVFICTHNSRRSHIAQIWAHAAASYFEFENIIAYSGGTEATAFNPRAVNAMRNLGFKIDQETNGENPHYIIRYSDKHTPFKVFSKRYDAPENPLSGFAAIMTCSHADENCPVIEGASVRISLPYDDPKDFDDTLLESIKYNERSMEIGREIFYAFFKIKQQ